jgi:serine/threonine protein kinase
VHQVGAGVLGPVFRAFDPENDRTVALKSFPLDLTPEQASEFAAGLERLAGLDLGHPSLIVPVASGAEGSTAYLVEEYFAADSVDIALRQYGPAPVPDAVRLVGQLAGGLDFAAAAGVHHGALHPRDVLVAPREVRLTGVGVAEALERVGFRPPVRRPYSAPERAETREWGTPADVYSLAAIAYELLTGRRPAGSGETVSAEPTIPAADPAALAEVFARAFSLRPDDRHPSALAFAAALKHALTGQPLEAASEAERSRPRRGRSGVRKAASLPIDEPPSAAASPDAPVVEPPATIEPVAAPEPDIRAAAADAPRPPERDHDEARAGASHPEALLPGEMEGLREALLAAEPELPAPPPLALDDLDLRENEAEPLERLAEPEPFEL